MFTLWERWGTALGLPAVVLWAVAFIFGSGSPDTSSASDSKITSWFASSSHQHEQMIAFFVFVAGTLCFIGFLVALRERLADAEVLRPRISDLAFGSGLVSAALWILSVIFLEGPAFTANDRAGGIAADTYRMLGNMGYLSWVAATLVGALTVWATSAVALRTQFLPRWYGWAGFAVGVIQLGAVIFFPIFLYWLWILATSALLTLRRRPIPSPAIRYERSGHRDSHPC